MDLFKSIRVFFWHFIIIRPPLSND